MVSSYHEKQASPHQLRANKNSVCEAIAQHMSSTGPTQSIPSEPEPYWYQTAR